MSNHDLATLDPAALGLVTGGAAAKTSSGTSPELAAALQGITSQLATLGKPDANKSSSMSTLLPMMLMLGKGGGGGGACGCGCGMANCGHR